MNKILLIGGAKFSGKSTLTREITKVLDKDFIVNRISFAGPFKEMLVKAKILTKIQAYGDEADKNTKTKVKAGDLFKEIRDKYNWADDYYLTARQVMQVYGSDLSKVLSPTIWVDTAITNIEENSVADIHIIDDFRFFGVEDKIDGLISRVYLTNLDDVKQKKDNHVSENSFNAAQADFNLVTNKADPSNLKRNVEDLYEHIMENFDL